MPAFSSKEQVSLDFADKTKLIFYFLWAFLSSWYITATSLWHAISAVNLVLSRIRVPLKQIPLKYAGLFGFN